MFLCVTCMNNTIYYVGEKQLCFITRILSHRRRAPTTTLYNRVSQPLESSFCDKNMIDKVEM